ncbi:MAG TPA: lanthionine synthetase LanC family protein [Terriglobales bacterium]|nr:lanthionine synthetase LanC family protein [Terriglobales bacterium]
MGEQTVALLKQFATPKTIGEAVACYSRSTNGDPEQVLRDAIPMLTQMIASRLLVRPDSQGAEEIEASFKPGSVVCECEVVQCLQSLEDTELYKVRQPIGGFAALKILRSAGDDRHHMLDREAFVLRHLAASVSPRLLHTDVWSGRPLLLMEWCDGVDVGTAASSLHREADREAKRKLLALCCNVLRSYSSLHEQGVIHCDIHPRNVIVDVDDRVRIVDFGLARHSDANREFGEPTRGGVGFFLEPEYAAAIKGGHRPPPATALGEQYSVAALIYSLLADGQYLDFSLTKDEMMRQIMEEVPLPFAQRSLTAWPEVEDILRRALSKDPADRFSSIAEFADRLSAVEMPQGPWRTDDADDGAASNGVVERFLARAGFPGDLARLRLSTAPLASLTYGAAGVACALYRIASQRQTPALLSLADVWCRRALADPENPDSYYNSEFQITPEIIGKVSAYHTVSGIHAVQALIAHAMCDVVTQANAVNCFMIASQEPCENLDLALGLSGTLLVSSLLLDTFGDTPLDAAPMVQFGNHIRDSIWRELDAQPPIRDGTRITYLGIAHGWAGMLYAALCWHFSSGEELPAEFEERLEELMECAEPFGRGLRWPWALPRHNDGQPATYMSGWCNGSAGHLFLCTAAYRKFKDEKYLKVAERAAWNTWDSAEAISNVCCGLAGQAYGLLCFYNLTGERVWLQRATALARRAAKWGPANYTALKLTPESLFKGETGVAVLMSDLDAPEFARMPLFEPEGWPVRSPEKQRNKPILAVEE